METTQTAIRGFHHAELRVRDLERSREFYEQFLGMKCAAWTSQDPRVCECVGQSERGRPGYRIVLSKGLPPDAVLTGMDHISFAAANTDDVMELHALAAQMNLRVTKPRVFDDRFQFFVFDPDGYKIEIVAEGGGGAHPSHGHPPP